MVDCTLLSSEPARKHRLVSKLYARRHLIGVPCGLLLLLVVEGMVSHLLGRLLVGRMLVAVTGPLLMGNLDLERVKVEYFLLILI